MEQSTLGRRLLPMGGSWRATSLSAGVFPGHTQLLKLSSLSTTWELARKTPEWPDQNVHVSMISRGSAYCLRSSRKSLSTAGSSPVYMPLHKGFCRESPGPLAARQMPLSKARAVTPTSFLFITYCLTSHHCCMPGPSCPPNTCPVLTTGGVTRLQVPPVCQAL